MIHTFTVREGEAELAIEVEFSNQEVLIRWLPISLGGPYPGGTTYVEPPILLLQHAETGVRREVMLSARRVLGLAGSRLLPGQPMPRIPHSVRIGLLRGHYQLTLRLTVGDAATRVCREYSPELGTFELSKDLTNPRHAPLNELAVVWVDPDSLPETSVPQPPAVENPSAYEPTRFFAAELAAGARTLLANGYCPWQTTHLPPEEQPAPRGAQAMGDHFHERGLAFYLESLGRAARLSGKPLYARAARYAGELLATNVTDAPWGGKWWAMNAFGESDNTLHAGLCSQGLVEAHELFGEEHYLRAAAEVLATWPYDADDHGPREVLDRDGNDPRGTFVYNQRMHVVLTSLQVGERLGLDDLVQRGTDALRRGIFPGMRDDGYWPYLRGGNPSSHYQIVLLKLLAQLAWEPGWSEDAELCHVVRVSADYALAHWCWVQDDLFGGTYLWSDVYGKERRPQLALAKAAGMASVLGFLAAKVDRAYLKPLIGTLRGIYSMRPLGIVQKMGPASWLHSSLLAPMLDLAVRGYRFHGEGTELESLRVTLPPRTERPDAEQDDGENGTC